jgi:hypothetical protein
VAASRHAELVRCGRPTCRCARGEPHGPYAYVYFRDAAGRQHKRYVTPDRLPDVLAAIRLRRAARPWPWRRLLAALRRVERGMVSA